MARLAIIDRADMNAEQARVYDAAKQAGGPVGGPYYAYIRLPKLFEASENLRGRVADGTPSASRSRSSTPSTPARLRSCPMRASGLAMWWRVRFSPTRASATRPTRP